MSILVESLQQDWQTLTIRDNNGNFDISTQVDSLQWEVNQLDVENRELRSQNSDASEQADLELKVEQLEGEARTELLVMKELLANKQADFEQTIGG